MACHWPARCDGRHGVLFALTLIACLLVTVTVTTETGQPIVYRIFLKQGETVVSYGDYVRVDGRVVFALPVSDLIQGDTQLISMPTGVVNWAVTEQYAEAARASHYAATRGEADFVRLSRDVAGVLNRIAFSDDRNIRQELARDARQHLVRWAATHHGYRQRDVREIVALLDEAIADLRTPEGADGLSLSLVATTIQPPRTPLLPDPSLPEIIEQGLRVAGLTPVPEERLSVLQAMAGLLDDPSSDLPTEWRRERVTMVSRELQVELQTSREYAHLGSRALARATTYTKDANVRGVKSVLDEMHARDAALGYRRADLMSALGAAVEARLADARSLRLARDHWLLRAEVFRRYQRDVDQVLAEFIRSRGMLDDIRLLAGPPPSSLSSLAGRLAQAAVTLDGMEPPLEVRPVHELYRGAYMLAASAVHSRHQAVRVGQLAAAWAAASAAAGSLMLFDHAAEQLDSTLLPPELN